MYKRGREMRQRGEGRLKERERAERDLTGGENELIKGWKEAPRLLPKSLTKAEGVPEDEMMRKGGGEAGRKGRRKEWRKGERKRGREREREEGRKKGKKGEV